MAAYAQSLTNILKQYLNHVVYIDDEFKVSWETKETETPEFPRRRTRKSSIDMEGEAGSGHFTEPESNLETFCRVVRKEYPEILLTPIVYEESVEESNLIMHMKNARMLIMDWSLSEKTTAIRLLNSAEFSGQLRFCVIYTSKLDAAKSEFMEKVLHAREDGFESGQCDGKHYDYIRVDSVIYMICEKDKFDFHMIMDSFVDIFVRGSDIFRLLS